MWRVPFTGIVCQPTVYWVSIFISLSNHNIIYQLLVCGFDEINRMEASRRERGRSWASPAFETGGCPSALELPRKEKSGPGVAGPYDLAVAVHPALWVRFNLPRVREFGPGAALEATAQGRRRSRVRRSEDCRADGVAESLPIIWIPAVRAHDHTLLDSEEEASQGVAAAASFKALVGVGVYSLSFRALGPTCRTYTCICAWPSGT